ncbi:DUF6809 family protein [Lutispora saccharofermentans]|uniref:Uncharacterized protein n=1 Tax=Lutispora saccharofermentans TaxID=3024236 RepID=A0ABT1NGL8_9FIRM|nr:DUF6809 family protein [Lutispora saccharofermentans]MCQ1530410.1 hypothetical protein [Lutispora saccharofermentans]
MKAILEELYNGNIYPAELIVPKAPRYRQINKEIYEMLKAWENKLPEGDYKLLEELLDLHCQSSSMEAFASFVYGFRLGAMIMLDVLNEK